MIASRMSKGAKEARGEGLGARSFIVDYSFISLSYQAHYGILHTYGIPEHVMAFYTHRDTRAR